jgi:hypothetical protein
MKCDKQSTIYLEIETSFFEKILVVVNGKINFIMTAIYKGKFELLMRRNS